MSIYLGNEGEIQEGRWKLLFSLFFVVSCNCARLPFLGTNNLSEKKLLTRKTFDVSEKSYVGSF